MIPIQGEGDVIAYGKHHTKGGIDLKNNNFRFTAYDAVRIFSLLISASLLSFSHMLTLSFPDASKYLPYGKEDGHL